MFEPIEIKYKDQTLTVPANKVLGLIASIEQHVNIVQLSDPASLSYVALARAYAAAIWYAGGKANVEEVYALLFEEGGASSVQSAITSLTMMMVPPSAIKQAEDSGEKK